MKKRFLLLFFFVLFSCFHVFSQDEPDSEETQQEIPAGNLKIEIFDADILYIIDSIFFNIDGITRPNALLNAAGIKKGQFIGGFANLTQYIQDKTQLLVNQRVLESANIDYLIHDINDDGFYPVDIFLNVKDTNNFVVFPNPKYSTSFGFSLSVKLLHNNFLGTMYPFITEAGYNYDELGRSNYLFSVETNTPFNVFGLNWVFCFLNKLIYRPQLDNELYYMNASGIYTNFMLGYFDLMLGLNVSAIINEEIIFFGESVYTDYNTLSFGPEIEISRIDWIGNFQKGFSFGVTQFYNYYFKNISIDKNPWGIYTELDGIIHLKITDFFGISSRLMFRYWALSAISYSAGDALRGIIDKDIHADLMLSLNLDFPFKIFAFRPSQWFNNEKFKLLDFDFHLSPVIDTAFYRNPVIKTENIHDNFLVSGGMEAIVYPQKFRSFCLRVSFGKILYGNSPGGNYELYIGGNLFY